jgi:hypothetical protein
MIDSNDPPRALRPPRGRAAALALTAAACLLLGCETAPPRAGAGAAAAGSPAGPPAGGSAAQAHNRLIEAYNNCNEAAFVDAYAPLFTLATSNTKQPVTTREGLQRYLAAGCGARPNPTAALVQQTTRVSGAITVLAGQYRFRVPVAGAGGASAPPAELLQNFTLVLERMGERWLVLAHHVSVAP